MSTSTSSAIALKRILVTGGNKGIGRAICERLLTEWNDTYVLLGSRNVQRGEQAIQEVLKAVGNDRAGRLELIQIDTASDESVHKAAQQIGSQGAPLYGIINNAAIGMADHTADNIQTNYFGVRRVNDALAKYLIRPGGRIVNLGSAAGPMFIGKLADNADLKGKLSYPWTITGGIQDLDDMARAIASDVSIKDGYGASKALLHAYTWIHAKMDKDLIINACSPGFIATDLTQGFGATKLPSDGAVPPCFLMMDDDVAKQPPGRYYGSDCLRSPIHVYRGPGDPPYENDDDLVEVAFATCPPKE